MNDVQRFSALLNKSPSGCVPYFHPIDNHAAKQHAVDILEQIQQGIPGMSRSQVEHLERMTIVAHDIAAAGLQSVYGARISLALETAFRYIPRSTAIHRIIDDLTGHRPAASAYLKAVHHSGSYLLTDDQTAAILDAARNAGVHDIALNEMCHRLEIKPEAQEQMGVPQTLPVARENAEKVVQLIVGLSPTAREGAATAAREMGWTLEELTTGPDQELDDQG